MDFMVTSKDKWMVESGQLRQPLRGFFYLYHRPEGTPSLSTAFSQYTTPRGGKQASGISGVEKSPEKGYDIGVKKYLFSVRRLL